MAKHLREWRNWQTRTFEGRVVYTVRVQVPFLAPEKSRWIFPSAFFCCQKAVSLESVAKPKACAMVRSPVSRTPKTNCFFHRLFSAVRKRSHLNLSPSRRLVLWFEVPFLAPQKLTVFLSAFFCFVKAVQLESVLAPSAWKIS